MLPKKLSLISPCVPPATSSSFSTTTKPDIFICIQGQVIPAEKKKLQQSNWIRNAGTQKNILVPSQSLNPKIIQMVIAFYDGCTIEIADTKNLTDLLQAVQYMGIKNLEVKLEEQIINQLKQFDTFLLLDIAFKFELEKLALICFQYLQIQEFQQMKYFQYALFDCDFKLFQIILRRHHVLKIRKKIEGLPAQDIQQLIFLYCKRHHYPMQIQQKLLQKYVFSSRIQSQIEQSKIKNSLRLHKQLNKNLGQSTTIYGNDSQKREKQLQVEMKTTEKGRDLKNMRPQSNPVRMRKYSMEMDKIFSQMGLSTRKDGLNVFPYSEKVIKVDEVIVEEQQCLNDYATAVHLDTQNIKFRKQKRRDEKALQYFQEQISEIGNKGSLELKMYEMDYQVIKKPNTKSMMFQDVIEQSVQQSMQQKSRKNNNFVASKNVKIINFRRY